MEECLFQFKKILEARKLDVDFKSKHVSKELLQLFVKFLSSRNDEYMFSFICRTMDLALRQPATWLDPEQIKWADVQQACTPYLAKALCTIVGMGRAFARSTVFAALRYCVDSAEFKALSAQDPAGLVELCAVDEDGIVRRAAQALHILPQLIEYRGKPFPKPDFPLSEECLSALVLFSLFSWL
jgi:hypothetical protein